MLPSPASADNSCPDDVYYMDGDNCIHKTGGVYSPGASGADQTSCVYAFINEPDKSKCGVSNPNPISTPTPAPPAGATTPISSIIPVNATNWKAEQQAAYTSSNLVFGAMCEMVHITGCPIKITKDDKTQLVLYNGPPSGGAIGQLTGVMVTLYQPPTSSVQYLADLGNSFGFAKTAYAQSVSGSGAGIINPVKTLWQAVRNIAYLAFILIFLMVGFMIMFRQKINPQTVVSIQTALPGLVVGLILVTFSYFIAALIIDFSFVGIPLVGKIISQGSPDNAFGSPAEIQKMAENSSIFQMFATTMGTLPEAALKSGAGVWDLFYSKQEGLALGLVAAVIGGIVGSLVLPGPGTLMGILTGSALSPLGITAIFSLVVPFILLIALLIQMFRLLLSLIATYLQLLVATITGPLVILASSIPGRGGGIGDWLKNLLANALVFPAVFGAFLFAGVILATKPETWRATPPLFGGLSTQLLQVLLAYGVILATPGIPDAVRGAFGIKPQQDGIVGAALGGFMGGVSVARAGLDKGTEHYRKRTETYSSEQQKQLAGYDPPPHGYMSFRPWMRIFGGRRNP